MHCPRCDHDNPAGVKFCGECGTQLVATCSTCQAPNPPENKFCGHCGSALRQPTPPAKFGSPHEYTPEHLADKILVAKSALAGERKQVTVLFADLKGSMEVIAERDPEEARKLLDDVIDHMMQAVHRYEGTVNHILGDGIMALFGAPIAHEDHAVRACYAALRMQESVKRYAAEVQRSQGIPIQIRVGLNSGEVVVGSIKNDLHMDYTAIGQTVHLAARMEQMAMPGSILTTADTLRLAEGYVQVKSLGPVSVKGMNEPLEVFEVTSAGSARSRLQAAVAHGLTRFVGRDGETEQLCRALELARAGRGQVAAVIGEPGVGKSRLFYEFTRSHRTVGCLIVESGSVSYGKATPFLPVIDLLKAYFKVQDHDSRRDARVKVTGKLLALDKSLEPALPALLSLLDVPVEDPQWRNLEPSQRRQRTLDAVKNLLLRESQVQPLILVFEDLHWIDSETQAFLDGLVDGLPAAPVLLLVNYRPEYQHGWGSKAFYRQLRVDPLPPAGAEELLAAVLGDDTSLQALKQLLVERTEGNPFFIEESIRTLVETKVLEGDRGRYRITDPLAITQIPASVQAVLAGRIDRLSPAAKRLLQFAAVIGKDFSCGLLYAVADLSEEELQRELNHLQAAEFLYQASFFPELKYTFKHALTHEVAYRSLLRASRRNCHQRIAQTLEERFPEVVESQPELLARHYTEAGRGAPAIPYWYRAGQKANARAAHTEAINYLNSGLELLKTVPKSQEWLHYELSLHGALGRALKDVKGYGDPEVERAYTRARELCREIKDAAQNFSTLLGLSIYFVVRAELQTARELGGQLLDIAEDARDPVLLVEAHYALGVSYFWSGEFVIAGQHLEQGIAHYDHRRHDSHNALFGQNEGVVCLCRGALNLWYLGYPDRALAQAAEAVTMARQLSHPASLAYVVYWVAFLHHQIRDLRKAREWADASLSLSTEQGFGYWPSQALILQGWAMTEEGQLAEGIVRIRQGLAALVKAGTEIQRAYSLGLLANAERQAGRSGEAVEMLEEALTLVEKTGGRWAESELHRLKGEALSQRDTADAARAEGCFREAIAVARRQQAKSLELRAAISLGRLWRRQEKRAEAKSLLTEVYGRFTEGFDTDELKTAKALLQELP